jgi:hypothetical protein
LEHLNPLERKKIERMTLCSKFIIWVLALIVSVSCSRIHQISLEDEEKAILEIHHALRDYHFEKDSIKFANQLADHFISVNHGNISTPSREELISRYNSYFSSVEFEQWDDLTEPVIRFADDASMAYSVVDKIVVVTYPDDDGKTIRGTTHFAWTAIYRKYEGEWKIDCVTSTNKPETSSPTDN